ncbi:hypothetical protein D1869_02545 [Sulfurisphaera ohwakuensis]|uniref:Putative pyridoxamine 5'-phosphate oxidase family protein n=1 Tax=Sulfurisphaera ohwakuensis TaxID=69656 RepID=A0A650CEK3_SULOH|nr:hypothetical protein [Sulfurisphaera ohwakuensis]MBB5252871.1 putative pyridoxamine 5'-phosphate oxidase family protein [Sulfurisphaera ohwakuensis]QGR16196.1 hypothetical protein D1869_02545 [Sulfurisphaera ohwakuensis]
MSFIVDLDKEICGSNVIDALFPNEHIIYKISKNNPYFQCVKNNFKIEIIKDEGDVVYFKILTTG